MKIVDLNGVVHEMYNNDVVYYGELPTSDSNKLRYGNNDKLEIRDKAEYIAYNWYYIPAIWNFVF